MDDGLGGHFVEVLCSTHETAYLAEGVTRGRTYRFRYRVRNAAGWSDYSSIAYVTPSSIPEAPPKPTYVNGTSTTIELSFGESQDDNGVPITSYQLEIDEGGDLTSSFAIVAGYSGTALSYTLTNGTDFTTTTAGTLYRIRIAAKNEDNQLSEYSEVLLAALGGLPSKPTNIVKVLDESSATSIMISWDKITSDVLPIQGYKLYADSGRADELVLAYDGSNIPGTNSFLLENVDVDLKYRINVTAININGEGQISDTVELQSCTTPSYFPAPSIDMVTETSVTISWQEPLVRGGCNITGYKIFWKVDSGTFAEYDSSNVQNKPFLSSYTLDLSSQTVGLIYQVYVVAVNRAGSTDSDTVSFTLSSVPSKPAVPTSSSDGYDLTIQMTAPSTGGSNITSYELQLDFKNGSGFVTIVGGDSAYTQTLTYTVNGSLLSVGVYYRARYRARNTAGWSDWSDIGYLLVAGVPSTPEKPTFKSATTSSITVSIQPSDRDNGAPVIDYMVYIDTGNFTSDVNVHDGNWTYGSGDYTLATSLSAGTIYRVGIIAVNDAGSSMMSQVGMFAASSKPNAPSTLTKVTSTSTLTSIGLTWSKVVQSNTAIYGYYVLYAKSGSSQFEVG